MMDADELIRLQQQLGLSDTKMAAALGVTRQTWRNWRSGRTVPTLAQNALRWLMELRRVSPSNDNIPPRLRFILCCECKRLRRAAYTAERGEEENRNRAAYYIANRDAELARKARYNVERRELRGVNRARRRASKLAAMPAWRTELDDLIETEANDLAKLREKATGVHWQVDHMIPLKAKTACGLHVGLNLQVIPATLNRWKKARMLLTEPGEWIRHA